MRIFEISPNDFKMMHYHRRERCGDIWGHPIPSCSGSQNLCHGLDPQTQECNPFKYVVNHKLI